MTARIAIVVDASGDQGKAEQTRDSVREAERVEIVLSREVIQDGRQLLDCTDAAFIATASAGVLIGRDALGSLAAQLAGRDGVAAMAGETASVPPVHAGLSNVAQPAVAMYSRSHLGSGALPEATIVDGLTTSYLISSGAAGAPDQNGTFRGVGEIEQMEVHARASAEPIRPWSVASRVAVIIPCYNDGSFVGGAVDSIEENEPVDVVIVDDCSTDPSTLRMLDALKREGIRVVRPPRNVGVTIARNTALATVTAPYVFSLDADDMVVPGSIGAMADLLDENPSAGVAYGDTEELTKKGRIHRAAPESIDAFRLAWANEMPTGALFRRDLLNELGGWTDPDPDIRGAYEDWDLWMSIAEREIPGLHIGPGRVGYRYRVQPGRAMTELRRKHPQLFKALKLRHPRLFEEQPRFKAASDMSPLKKTLYPIVYGGRPRFAIERPIKNALDWAGVWTRIRRRS